VFRRRSGGRRAGGRAVRLRFRGGRCGPAAPGTRRGRGRRHDDLFAGRAVGTAATPHYQRSEGTHRWLVGPWLPELADRPLLSPGQWPHARAGRGRADDRGRGLDVGGAHLGPRGLGATVLPSYLRGEEARTHAALPRARVDAASQYRTGDDAALLDGQPRRGAADGARYHRRDGTPKERRGLLWQR